MNKSHKNNPRFLLKLGLAGLIISVLSVNALAQDPPRPGAIQPAAHAGQQPVNDLPNPYLTQRNFGSLPDSAIDPRCAIAPADRTEIMSPTNPVFNKSPGPDFFVVIILTSLYFYYLAILRIRTDL